MKWGTSGGIQFVHALDRGVRSTEVLVGVLEQDRNVAWRHTNRTSRIIEASRESGMAVIQRHIPTSKIPIAE